MKALTRGLCILLLAGLTAAIALGQTVPPVEKPKPGDICQGQLMATLTPGATVAQAKAFAERHGLDFVRAMKVPNRFLFRIKEWGQRNAKQLVLEKVEALKNVPGVSNPFPNYYYTKHDSTPNDPLFSQQWALTQVKMPAAWDFQKGANTVTVVFMDDNFDLAHKDLTLTPSSRIVETYNAYDGSTDVTPPPGVRASHGTATSSIAMAATDDGFGIAGVCWAAVKFLPIRIGDESGSLIGAAIEDGYQHVIDHFTANSTQNGVLNMSYGSFFEDQTQHDLLDQIRELGVITVASSGNDRPFFVAGFPASYESVISAAATGPGGAIASYSSPGLPDRSRKVDFAAPGGDGVGPSTGMLAAAEGGGHEVENGTSFSAPMITGACALLLSQGVPEDEVFDLLKDTANTYGQSVPNVDYGYGEIDVFEALRRFGGSASFITPKSNDIFEYRRIRVRIRVGNLVEESIVVTDNGNAIDYGELVDIGDPTFKEIDFTHIFTTGNHTLTVNATSSISNQLLDPAPSVTFKVQPHNQTSGTAMFTIPYDVTTSTPEQLLPGSFVLQRFVYLYDQNNNRLNDGEWARYPDARAGFHPPGTEVAKESTGTDPTPTGVGYFLTLNITTPIQVLDGPDTTTSYLIRLKPGWQMFGNPFPFVVDWNTCEIMTESEIFSMTEAVNEEFIRPQLFRWSPIALAYSWRALPGGQLHPWEGAWVYCRKACWLRVHPVPTNPRSPMNFDDRPDIRGDGFAMRITATADGRSDASNYIGATTGLREAYDIVGEAPSPLNGVRLSILGPDGRNAYAQYLKERNSRNFEWPVVVTVPEAGTEVTLSWEEIVRPNSLVTYTLVDTATGRRLSMNTSSSYRFTAGGADLRRMFKVIAVPDASTKLVVTGVNVTSSIGRGGASFAVHYSLSKDAQVTVAILSPTGKQVAILDSGNRSFGLNQANWNGRDQAGVAQPPGVYMAQITATGVNGEQVRVVSPIVLTR